MSVKFKGEGGHDVVRTFVITNAYNTLPQKTQKCHKFAKMPEFACTLVVDESEGPWFRLWDSDFSKPV